MRWLRRLSLGNPRHLAREAQARHMTPDAALSRRFCHEYLVRKGGSSDFIVFGYVEAAGGHRAPVGLPIDSLVGDRGTHVLDQGPSRSGKTRLALSIMRQVMRMSKLRVWSWDPKGDLSAGRARLVAELATRPGGQELLERLRVIKLFDRTNPPPLRLTAREEGVSVEVQAASIGTALAESSGAQMGTRMVPVLQPLAELAVQTNRPLTCVLDWLRRPAAFLAAAADSPDERLREAARNLPRENKESVRALIARLERVLLLPSVRRALEAPTCLNMTELLRSNDVDIDASNPPAGEEAAVAMLCAPLFGRASRAILNRRVDAATMPVLCFIDELPELLGRFEAETSISRLTSLAGSRLVNFFLILQDRVQLGPELFHLLRTNCAVEALFRPSHRDAELVAHALPVPDGVDRPSQVREALVRKLTRLPRRQYLFWYKPGVVPAHFVTAPSVDLDKLPPAERLQELLRDQEPEVAPPVTSLMQLTLEQLGQPTNSTEPTLESGAANSDFPELG